MTEVLFIAYFLVLVATTGDQNAHHQRSVAVFDARVFPNWKFFHAVGYVPHLYARSAVQLVTGELQWTDWVLIYPRRVRRLSHLVHNPDTNIGLAQQNMVDHFWADLHDLPEGVDRAVW